MSALLLPRALAPWAKELDLFPRALALSLAPLLPRLSGLLAGTGPVTGPEGDPDGFDGLARRGSYERLLPSEWLLLSEAPEEFLRRVAMNEHAFLHLSRRLSPAGRDVVALLDAGPDQLGSPRIAHIAALIVLAARAAKEQAAFSFGVLAAGERTLHVGLSAASLTAMLESGSTHVPSPDVIEAYLALPAVANASERWLIGGRDLRPSSAKQSTSALIVTEPVEIESRRLHVTVLAAGASRERTADLDLPEERACVRLLQDPLDIHSAPRVRAPKVGVDVDAGLLIAADGRRLFLVGSGRRLVSLVIPSSSRMAVPPPAVVSPPLGSTLIAAGYNDVGSVAIVSRRHNSYYLSQLTRNCRRVSEHQVDHPLTPNTPFPEVAEHAKLSPIWLSKSQGICFFDADHTPIHLFMGPAARRARDEDARPPWQWSGPVPGPPPVPEGMEIAAILRNVVTGAPSGILLLNPPRTRLELFADNRGEVIARTSSPIRRVVASEAHRLVAYLTEDGYVGVHSLREGATIVSMAAEEALSGDKGAPP